MLDAGNIGSDMTDGDAHVGKNVPHQTVRSAVELRGGDHFIAGLQRSKERGGNSRHAGRSDDSSFGAFEAGDLLFSDGNRRIAAAGIALSIVFAFLPYLHFFPPTNSK